MTAGAASTKRLATNAFAATATFRSPPWLSFVLNKCRNIDHVKQTHSHLIIHGLSQCTSSMAQLLHCCAVSSLTDLGYASLVFDRIERPTVFMWNTMIRGLSSSPHPQKSLIFFTRMLRGGGIPDRHTYPLVLKAISRSRFGSPDQFHGQTVKFGLNFDLFVRNALISAYAREGKLDSACRVFDEIILWDSVGWTALVDGFVKNGSAKQGLGLFCRMRALGVEVNEVTVVSVLRAVGMVGDLCLGRCIHGYYVECGRVIQDVYVGSALIDMYAKCGCCEDAQQFFDEMHRKNVVTWSALIAGYVLCSRYREALSVFQSMLLEETKPNQVTLTSVLTACAQVGALDQGRWVHSFIDKKRIDINITLGTALIDMYAKCGSIAEALDVFMALGHKDVYPWTAMINGLAMHGYADMALDLFARMLHVGVQPNAVTFIGVITACSHGGLVDQGKMYFDCMNEVYGVEPTLDHYGCVVDLLGRSGRLQEALCLIRNMPMDPSPGVWGALFSACMIYKDFELGELVGSHLIKLQPHHSGRYSLLANMYSTAQMWHKAARVRKLMKGTAMEKVPGFSWIEINGVIDEFIALDMSHSKSKDIDSMLNGLTMHIQQAAGHLPDNLPCLFDIDVQ